jgi:hypothetical protein
MVCLAFLAFACSRSEIFRRGVISAVFPRMGVAAISSDFLDTFPSMSCIFDLIFVGSACLFFLLLSIRYRPMVLISAIAWIVYVCN